MRSAIITSLAAVAFLITANPIPVVAGPPAGVQGAMSRDVTRGLPSNQPTSTITVGDPQKAEAIGLPGLKKGDKVEVSRDPEGKWIVKDPASGRKVILDNQPDLGS